MAWKVVHGDCRNVLPQVPADSIDAAVTDPPYELGFMGKSWDSSGVSFQPATWAVTYRVLKPGARLLAFGGSRTSHRIVCAIEDAGFVIEDGMEFFYSVEEQARELWETLSDSQRAALVGVLSAFSGGASWLYGSGWPKHKSKLKPAHEPICVARKGKAVPLNIDACRLETTESLSGGAYTTGRRTESPSLRQGSTANIIGKAVGRAFEQPTGRWPANVAFDEETAALLDEQSGILTSGANPIRRRSDKTRSTYGAFEGQRECVPARGVDSGGASRFFYVAKASRKEREAGLESFPKRNGGSNVKGYTADVAAGKDRNKPVANNHPTVKPIALMRYLVKLITPPGGLVLDQFCGSGTTGIAAVLEGFDFAGIEKDHDCALMAHHRIAHWEPKCAHSNGVTNVRPWPDAGFSIGECVDCHSTIEAKP